MSGSKTLRARFGRAGQRANPGAGCVETRARFGRAGQRANPGAGRAGARPRRGASREIYKVALKTAYKRDRPLSIIFSAAVLIPFGLLSLVAGFFIMPLGIAAIVCSAALLACAVMPFIPKARVNCPVCGKIHTVTKRIRAFRCGGCGERLEIG